MTRHPGFTVIDGLATVNEVGRQIRVESACGVARWGRDLAVGPGRFTPTGYCRVRGWEVTVAGHGDTFLVWIDDGTGDRVMADGDSPEWALALAVEMAGNRWGWAG